MSVLPLDGFAIGVTADRRAKEQIDFLKTQGATVVRGVTERTVLADLAALRRVTLELIASPPDLLVTTSAIGVRSWITHATSWGLDHDLRKSLRSSRILAVGAETLGELAAADVQATLRTEADPSAVAKVLHAEAPTTRCAAVQLDGEDSPDAVEILESAGATVHCVATFRWQLPKDKSGGQALVRAATDRRLHAITFTTAAAVRGALHLAGEINLRDEFVDAFRGGVEAACVGPHAAEAAVAAGIEHPLVPDLPRLAYLLRDLSERLARQRRTLAARGDTAIVQGELVLVGDRRLSLSGRERALFDALVARPGEVLSKDELLRRVWPDGGSRHLVEVTVSRLRDRLGPTLGSAVVAVRRRGYRFEAESLTPES